MELLAVNRLCAPGSELSIHERWFSRTAMDFLLGCDETVAGKDRLYRALDKALEHRDALIVISKNVGAICSELNARSCSTI